MKTVLDKISDNYPESDKELLFAAYRYAEEMHEGQKRASGEPYFVHPCAVAEILIDLGMDTASVAAAFLHDVIEDTAATAEDIRTRFGTEILTLVDGVTKLDKISFRTHEDEDAENFRKIFVAMANDVRVIIIKLADRLHNMRSLNFLSNERQQRIAKETLDIFTPLAGRLGISQIKCELEDLCLKYLDPEAYEFLVVNIHQKLEERRSFVDFVVTELKAILEESGIDGEVFGRPKHFYSIYRKMKNQGKSLDQIYDLSAVRVIVGSMENCYEVLGKIHKKWKPVPGRIKDYIATPKRNLYQSLHTTVVTNFGQIFEIQIRTQEMHKMAEYGIAAHWKYKEQKSAESNFDQRLTWIRDVMDWQGSLNDSKEFVDSLKNDLYSNELLVFTPHGKVISLPLEATPVDFAYAIHSEVGNKCVGAKVNNRIVPLNSVLHTGDVVEILTSASAKGPSWDWFKYVKSGSARAKMRQFFKREMKEENIKTGKVMLEAEAKRKGYNLGDILTEESFKKLSNKLVFSSVNEMMASVGYGAVSVNQVIFKLIDYYKKEIPKPVENSDAEKLKYTPSGSVSIKGMNGLLVRFAHCCNPVPGDEIVGFVSRGRGVIVHRKDCSNLKNEDAERLQPAQWTGMGDSDFIAGIKIIATDDSGVVAFITTEISLMKLNMTQINGRINKDKQAEFDIRVKLNKRSDIDLLVGRLKKDKRIIDVFRTSN
ncbi:MAG: bifunctional (p)ppGpp synthetase/guanosine-3',5'-bis(diphosphate) 3'-pyrophosphohydrolase [Clostridia bacterium]|jgi:GTP pyrophosphokinase|nr:bifunctional (p)ppGpp synthetase/guanosine-3',5'-bis(diphosphate) 3'-pyrophosphohydrolase [Clostridia bacterium]